MPAIQTADGHTRWLDDDEYAHRLAELRGYDRPTASQRIELAELETHERAVIRLRSLAANPAARMGGADPGSGYDRAQFRERNRAAGLDEDQADQWRSDPRLGAVMSRHPDTIVRRARDLLERDVRREAIPGRSAEVLEHAITRGEAVDRLGVAQYISVTGSETYRQAFARALLDPHGPGWLAPEPERAAIRDAREARRALGEGTPSAWSPGSYPVPYQLDPTVTLSSDGVTNPLRQLARVEQIIGKEWLGVTSTGVQVTRADEFEAASDAAPDLQQPGVAPTRVQAFVQFSIEVEQDWNGLLAELAMMLSDAKDVEEATSFVSGAGTGNQPQGIVTALAGGASEVVTAGTGSFTLTDVYDLQAAVPPRFRSRAAFTAALPVIQAARRMEVVTTQSAVQGSGDNMTLVGQKLAELSTMDDTIATGKHVLLCGDFRNLLLVDRLGMSIEIIPQVFAASTGLPTGSRGLYAIWRTSSRVLVPNAFRLLKVK